MSSSDEDASYSSDGTYDDHDYDECSDLGGEQDSSGGGGIGQHSDSDDGETDPPFDPELQEAYDAGYEDGFADGLEEGSRVDGDGAEAFDAEAPGGSKAESTEIRTDDDDSDNDSDCYYQPVTYHANAVNTNPHLSTTASSFFQPSPSTQSTISVSSNQYPEWISWFSSAPPIHQSSPAFVPQQSPCFAPTAFNVNSAFNPSPTYDSSLQHRRLPQDQQQYPAERAPSVASTSSTRISISRNDYQSLTDHLKRLDIEIKELRRQQQPVHPPQPQQSTKQRDKQAQACFNCHQRGHIAQFCPTRAL
ncbi:hypothetical protein A4X09_0g7233 [Tilletia walkeri]|uniref:CCHC-type domain-containing protein n=1 Tax=Tilletia walkeri TaxID=117179 RepID=A0A8X7N3M6_9BASI|nr:hypothetical protein A4X09_0g7233 [Tilletia walkeri]